MSTLFQPPREAFAPSLSSRDSYHLYEKLSSLARSVLLKRHECSRSKMFEADYVQDKILGALATLSHPPPLAIESRHTKYVDAKHVDPAAYYKLVSSEAFL